MKGACIQLICVYFDNNNILRGKDIMAMVTSIILIKAERTKINEVAEKLSAMEGISEVYSVSGKYDLIAIARVPSNDDLADLVTKNMVTIDAITKSETMLAFKAFSRHDLEAMFSIGE